MFTGTLADNLVRCAAGKATRDYIERNDLIRNAKELGSYILKSLGSMSEGKESIGDVRGRGLIVGFELVKDKLTKEPEEALSVTRRAMGEGLLLRRYGR